MDTLIPKFAISIICTIIFLLILFNKEKIHSITKGKENYYLFFSILLARFIPVLVIFLLLNYDATSDVKMFYDWAQSAKSGYLVYRDFRSPYAPLFSYITALPLYIYNHVNSILLLMVIIETSILLVTYNFYSKRFSKSICLHSALLYLSLPATFILSVIGGQEDIWMWGIIIVSLYIFQKTEDSFWVGLILGLGMVITKVIFVFSLPIAFILLKKRMRYTLGLIIVGLPTLAFLVYFGGDSFLLPIQEANNPRTPNIWSILNPFLNIYSGIGIKNLNLLGLITNLMIIIFLSAKAKSLAIPYSKAFPLIWILSSCWLMLIQQSSLSNYCYMFLMPLFFIYVDKENQFILKIFLTFSFACAIQPPIWWGQKMPIYKGLHDILKPINLLEYSLEIFIVSCIIYFCIIIYKTLFTKNSPNGAI